MLNRVLGLKKRWFVAMVAMALLAVGLTTGTVLAGGGSGHGSSDAVLDWVASDLGVTRAALDDAFSYAYDQQANASFEAWVQALVDAGTLDDDQATEANGWFDNRPEDSGHTALKLAKISDADAVADYLAKEVDDGDLTQDESDALSAWHGDRPEALPTSSRGKGGKHGGRGGRR